MTTPFDPINPIPTTDPGRSKLPSNPTPLSAPQEQQVRDLYYQIARDKCASEIGAFAACATGRTISIVWKCRPQKLTMNGCLLQYQGQEAKDRARTEWFATAEERNVKKAEERIKLEERRQKHREWWTLDERGKLQGKRAEVPQNEATKKG